MSDTNNYELEKKAWSIMMQHHGERMIIKHNGLFKHDGLPQKLLKEIEKRGFSYEEFTKANNDMSEYFNKNYHEKEEENNQMFIDEVVDSMEELIAIKEFLVDRK